MQAVMQAYGVDNSKKKAMPNIKTRKIDLSDNDITAAQITVTNEEQRFLRLHAKVLKDGPVEKTRRKVRILIYLWRLLPGWAKVIMSFGFGFSFSLILPVIVYSLYKVFSSWLAIAKVMMLLIFVLLVWLLQKFVVKV